MSCQIKGIANLTNISNIKELLFGESTRKRMLLYSFILLFKEIVNINMYFSVDIPQDELPLQDCFISLSSTGDVLAMAYNTKMIILICMYYIIYIYLFI